MHASFLEDEDLFFWREKRTKTSSWMDMHACMCNCSGSTWLCRNLNGLRLGSGLARSRRQTVWAEGTVCVHACMAHGVGVLGMMDGRGPIIQCNSFQLRLLHAMHCTCESRQGVVAMMTTTDDGSSSSSSSSLPSCLRPIEASDKSHLGHSIHYCVVTSMHACFFSASTGKY